MNHNQFANGTFDVEPYETTMDSSFYPRKKFNTNASRNLQKMYNDPSQEDEEMTFSPPSSTMNYNPSLNNNFKRRIVNKPLQLQNRRGSRFSKERLSSVYNESSEGSTIPNIHRKHNHPQTKLKVGKLFKNGKAPLSTSRNRNMPLNQSYNGVPKLKEKFTGNINPNFLNNSNEGLDFGGINNTIDLSGNATQRNLYFPALKDSNGIVFNLQKQIVGLKEQLSEKDSELTQVKHSLKYTNISELQAENSALYEEISRLRDFIYDLASKKEPSNSLEQEVMRTLDSSIQDPKLERKFKNRKSDIEQ